MMLLVVLFHKTMEPPFVRVRVRVRVRVKVS